MRLGMQDCPYKTGRGGDKKAYDRYRYRVRSSFLGWLYDFTCQNKDCDFRNETRLLNFHHTDPENKSFVVAGSLCSTNDFEMIIREMLKCEYLCETCHYQRHAKMGDLNEDFKAINRRRHTYLSNLLGCTD